MLLDQAIETHRVLAWAHAEVGDFGKAQTLLAQTIERANEIYCAGCGTALSHDEHAAGHARPHPGMNQDADAPFDEVLFRCQEAFVACNTLNNNHRSIA